MNGELKLLGLEKPIPEPEVATADVESAVGAQLLRYGEGLRESCQDFGPARIRYSPPKSKEGVPKTTEPEWPEGLRVETVTKPRPSAVREGTLPALEPKEGTPQEGLSLPTDLNFASQTRQRFEAQWPTLDQVKANKRQVETLNCLEDELQCHIRIYRLLRGTDAEGKLKPDNQSSLEVRPQVKSCMGELLRRMEYFMSDKEKDELLEHLVALPLETKHADRFRKRKGEDLKPSR